MPITRKSLLTRLNSVSWPKDWSFASRRSSSVETRENRTTAETQQPSLLQQPHQVDQAQRQSSFFQLPAELRNQMYHEVFGPDICHIVSWKSGLGHYCCGGVKTDTWHLDGPCWGHRWFEGDLPQVFEQSPNKSALLQTCKRAHVEGTPILYSSKYFIFTAPSVILDFERYVRFDTTLAHVTFVELCAPPPYTLYVSTEPGARKDLSDWKRSVSVLKRMTGLQTLYVMVPNTKVYDTWQHSKASEQHLLEPLRQLHTVGTLIVWIAWHEGGFPDQHDEEADSYPFELKRFQGHTALS